MLQVPGHVRLETKVITVSWRRQVNHMGDKYRRKPRQWEPRGGARPTGEGGSQARFCKRIVIGQAKKGSGEGRRCRQKERLVQRPGRVK